MSEPPLTNERLLAACQEFGSWWEGRSRDIARENTITEPLYQYTDMNGLQGILASETMWFTNIFHLNDPSELSHGLEIGFEILGDEFNTGGDAVKAFCHWVRHVLLKSGGEIFGYYVASFSRAPNDLAQWRAYADDARGVALGFAPALFVEQDVNDLAITEKTFIGRVDYDPKSCRRNFTEAITRATGLIRDHDAIVTSPAEREAFGKEMARTLAVALIWYAATCKHPAYAHEKETRLLLINDAELLAPHVRTRVRASKLVPYIASPFAVRVPGNLNAVTVGPAADAVAEDAVRALLSSYGMPTGIVSQSDIPYTSHR